MEVAASVIAVIQISEKVIKYIRDASGATEERKRLREQIRGCCNILLTLRDGIEDSEEGEAWADTVTILATPLARLQKALELAAAKLLKKHGARESFAWPFRESEVQKLMGSIESEKSILLLALENNSARLLQEINLRSKINDNRLQELTSLLKIHTINVEELNDKVSLIHDAQTNLSANIESVNVQQKSQGLAEKRRKIIEWLSNIDHAMQQHHAISRRQAGTGGWFLQSSKYQHWSSTSGEILFCPGIPGAGKTILTSIVVADLWKRHHQDENTAIAFFYCDFRRREEHTVECILSSVLKQLVQRRVVPSKEIQELYDDAHKEQRSRPLYEDILGAIRQESQTFSSVFLVVDALDECETSVELLTELIRLQAQCGFNLLTTARPLPDIVTKFQSTQVNEISASSEDVKTYLEAHIHRLPKFVSANKVLQADIIASISQSIEGMFLLAQLHLDSLVGKRSPNAIRTALAKFTTGSGAYDVAYTAAMKRIESQVTDQVELAKQVLAWVVLGEQLTVYELQEALGVESGQSELDLDNCPDVDDMVSVCAGLITVDQHSHVIRLVHYTTQEFFDRTYQDWFPEAHAMITTACMTYLSFSIEGGASGYVDLSDFYVHAGRNWGKYARLAPSVFPQVLEFLLRHANETLLKVSTRKLSRKLVYVEKSTSTCGSAQRSVGLHLAAQFGLVEAMAALLEHGLDPGYRIPGGLTPLLLAANCGHLAIVRLLLDQHHVDANVVRYDKLTSLHLAARGGHHLVAQALLDGGAHPRILSYEVHDRYLDLASHQFSTDYKTALDIAAHRLDESLVRVFIPQGAAIDRHQPTAPESLNVSLERGGLVPKTVQPLLRHTQDYYSVALEVAVRAQRLKDSPYPWGCEDDWAAPTSIEERDRAGCARLSIARMLLDAGADVNNPNGDFSPLYHACNRGDEDLVQFLIDAGADPYCARKGGGSMLHLVSKHGYHGLIRPLLNAGAGLNGYDAEGDTPLAIARDCGHEAASRILLECGALEEEELQTLWRQEVPFLSSWDTPD